MPFKCVAMTAERTWFYGDYVRALGENAIGYAPLPTFTPDQTSHTWMKVFGWSMAKKTAESDRGWAAWRLIDHFSSRHTLLLAAQYQQGLSSRKSMVGILFTSSQSSYPSRRNM